MSIGHGSASDVSEASSQDASAISHVTVEDDIAEASSTAAEAEPEQNGHEASLNSDLSRASDTVLQQPDHQLEDGATMTDTGDGSEGLQPNGRSLPHHATMHQSQQEARKSDSSAGEAFNASAQQQQEHVFDKGHAAASASDSCTKHQAAASFNPEAAKEAELADQHAGAVVVEPNAAACEPASYAQKDAINPNDQSAAPPAVADAPKSANSGSARSQPTRSSSRNLQSQAKPTPWR